MTAHLSSRNKIVVLQPRFTTLTFWSSAFEFLHPISSSGCIPRFRKLSGTDTEGPKALAVFQKGLIEAIVRSSLLEQALRGTLK